MRLALCNEVLRDVDFSAQCGYAASLGYGALEIAPFTLAEDPLSLTSTQRAQVRRAASDAGIAISGLHWLLVKPDGLSVTSPDATVRKRTIDAMRALVGLCADIGGSYLVHGSPAQRRTPEGVDRATARGWIAEALAAAAVSIVERIGSPALATMLDTKSASLAESSSVVELIQRWLPRGLIRHVQLNDRNRRGPGQGSDRFAPVLRALIDHGYDGDLAVEPFDYAPDGRACAAFAAGYVRALLEALGAFPTPLPTPQP